MIDVYYSPRGGFKVLLSYEEKKALARINRSLNLTDAEVMLKIIERGLNELTGELPEKRGTDELD